jgi:hypothetical protein
MKEKIIYTRWLAIELIKQGFPVVRVERNPSKPEFNTWVFAESEEFLKVFANIANRR